MEARERSERCTRLCGSSRGVFESKRTTCLCDKAFPSIGSTSQLPPCHRRIGCLLSKSRHLCEDPHRCSPCNFPRSNSDKSKPCGGWPPAGRQGDCHRKAAETLLPSHGRREGSHLAPHAASWAVKLSLAAAHATLAAGLGESSGVKKMEPRRPLNVP